jgi:hypothetical protein
LTKLVSLFAIFLNTKELRLIAGQHIYFTSGNSETETWGHVYQMQIVLICCHYRS